jgi:uncharacterized protein with PQ loop repeat
MDESLKNYSEELKTLIQKSYDSFERQLNYISAGALGVSMLFVEKVVKDIRQTQCNWVLIFSWSLFTLTLVSNLLSHIYTSNIHDKTLSEIYSENYDHKNASSRNKKIKIWNIVSIILLFLGIIFQIIFISLNI